MSNGLLDLPSGFLILEIHYAGFEFKNIFNLSASSLICLFTFEDVFSKTSKEKIFSFELFLIDYVPMIFPSAVKLFNYFHQQTVRKFRAQEHYSISGKPKAVHGDVQDD